MCRIRSCSRLLAVLSVALAATSLAAVPPPAPELRTVFPCSVQRGSEQTVTFSGSNLVDVTAVAFSGTGLTATIVQTPNASTLKVKIAAAPDAPIGLQEVRLVSKNGLSNCRYIYVDDLPIVTEKEQNTLLGQAQPLEQLPVAIDGVITGSDRDFFRFYAKAGQQIVAEAVGRRLLPYLRIDDRIGWFDPCLELYSADGHRLAEADDFRMRPDAVLVYRIPADGEYILCIRDTAYRGRGDFVYHLRVGPLPLALDWFPIGGKAGTSITLKLLGANLPAEQSVTVPAFGERPGIRSVQIEAGGRASNRLELWSDALESLAEKEPNDTAEQAYSVTIGQAVDGTLERRGQVDWFEFAGKKGQVVVIETVARRVGSPLDPYLELFNEKGGRLAANDDAVGRPEYPHPADARIRYRLPADGKYRIRLRDMAWLGGPDYHYRLLLYLSKPDYELTLAPTDPYTSNPRLNIAQTVARAIPVNGVAYLRVRVAKYDGFNAPIELAIDGLPEGVTFSGGTIAPGQNELLVTLHANDKVQPGQLIRFTLRGRAKVGEQEVVRTARAHESHSYIADQRREYPVAVTATATAVARPLRLAVKSNELKAKPGQKVELAVSVERTEEAKVPVKLSLLGLPRGFSATTASVAADQAEGKLTITVPKNAAAGTIQLVVQAEATVQKKSQLVWSPVVRLVVEPQK